MTIQLKSTRHGKSKLTLAAAMNESPSTVSFYDPSIINELFFTAADMEVGASFACVLDPDTRRRFATVKRTANGYRVS